MARASQEFGEWPIKRLNTEVVGSGPKSAADMDRQQATEAFRRILADEPDHTTLGAFWLANRWKRNTPEELGAFVDVMLTECVETVEPDADPVDCGANYDGKAETPILGIAAGAIAAGAGTPVVVHSGEAVPSQKDPSYKDVLDELGVRTELDPAESANMVDEVGFGYYYQPTFNPGIDDLYDRRDQMGVRTFVNTIETLANPAGASTHLGSFYHLAFAKKMIETVQESREAVHETVIMFQGMEGYDDIRPGYTKVAEWEGGDELTDYDIETADYGMDFEYEDLEVDDVAVDSAAITEAVLAGDRDDQFRDAVLLNAAVRIYAGGDANSIEDGLDVAEAALNDGSGASVLDELRSF